MPADGSVTVCGNHQRAVAGDVDTPDDSWNRDFPELLPPAIETAQIPFSAEDKGVVVRCDCQGAGVFILFELYWRTVQLGFSGIQPAGYIQSRGAENRGAKEGCTVLSEGGGGQVEEGW